MLLILIKSIVGICYNFFLDMWYVVVLSSELIDKLLGWMLLNEFVVLFCIVDGVVNVLEDCCCYWFLFLFVGILEDNGVCCGYYGLLFNGDGKVIEILG